MDKETRKKLKRLAKHQLARRSAALDAELRGLNPHPFASDAYIRREIEIREQARAARRGPEAARAQRSLIEPEYFVIGPDPFAEAAPNRPAPPTDRERLHVVGYFGSDRVRDWMSRLRFFRIRRASGGHVGDLDELIAAIAYRDEADLRRLAAPLGFALEAYAPVKKPLPPGARAFLQPGKIRIAGESLHCRVLPGRIQLSMLPASAELMELTDADIEQAARVEVALQVMQARMIDPPVDSPRCISSRYYPDLFPESR